MLNLLARGRERARDAEGHAHKGAVSRFHDLFLDGQQTDEVLNHRSASVEPVPELQRHDFAHPVKVEQVPQRFVVRVRFADAVVLRAKVRFARLSVGTVQPRQKTRCVS